MPLESEVLQTTVRMWAVESNPVEKQILQMRARAIASTNDEAVAELIRDRPELEQALKQITTVKLPDVKGGEKEKAEPLEQ